MTKRKKHKNNRFNIIIALVVVGLAVGAVGYYLSNNNSAPAAFAYGDMSATEIQQLLQVQSDNPDLIVLDVRTPDEFSDAHINPNGLPLVNLDFYNDSFATELTELDKSKSYVIYCRSGNRSTQTVALLKGMGFENVYHLQGGIQAWQQANLPTQ